MRFFRTRVLLWPMLLLLVAVVGAAGTVIFTLWLASPFSLTTQSRSAQAVEAMERTGDVVVLNLHVAAVDDDKTNLKFYGLDVFGTDRATFLRYEFDARLGFSAEDVVIKEAGEGELLVSIPQFKFIGTDNFDSEVSSEKNGFLSWITPEIDDREMADKFLDDARRQQYVDDNTEFLKEGAEAFYTDVVNAIDPALDVNFAFTGENTASGETDD